MRLTHLSLMLAAGLLLAGCSARPVAPTPTPTPTPSPASSAEATSNLQVVEDPAKVKALALQVIQGAQPLPGDVGLLAVQGPGLLGVVLAPPGWTQTPVKINSPDMAILLMSIDEAQAKKASLLEETLRNEVVRKTGLAYNKTRTLQPFVLKVGGYDYPGQKVEAISAQGNKSREFWVDLPQQGHKVKIILFGLAGWQSFFPEQRMVKFLDQLPRQPLPPVPHGE